MTHRPARPARLSHPLAARRFKPLPLAVAAALVVSSASAQQAPKPDDGKVETVVITATKRLQPLQETPIAVSVLGGAALEEGNLNNLSTISAQIPTVNFRANASNKDTNLFIRGVGTISTSPGVEPTVSTVIDGVVTFRSGQATLDLVEVDRIEILRGPQGTLFGKNASAGAINIVTRAPTKEFSGYADLAGYQGGETRARLGVSGGNDLARGSISAMAGKFDGNVTNVADGSKVNGYDRKGLRGRVEITPIRDFKATLIADYSNAKDTTPTGVLVSTNPLTYPSLAPANNALSPLFAAAIAPVVGSASNRQINSEMQTRVEDTNQGFSAQLDWSFGGYQVTSITARRTWKNTQFQDQDRLPMPYSQFAQTADRGDLDFSQTSQELRIATTDKRFFDYVAGLFYIEGKTDEQYRRDVTRCPGTTATALPSGLIPCSAGSRVTDNGVANYGVRSKSQAVFGEGTFNFSNELRAITGLRYTLDDLSYYHGRVASATGVPGVNATRATIEGSTREHALSGRIGPQFKLTPEVMVYGTYSKGYKGPAYNVFFNMQARDDIALAPEKSKSWEVGVKSELLDRRLRLNVAAFQTDYDGYQANVPDLVGTTVVTRTINAGTVSTKGVEIDATARPTSNLTINAAVANIMARVKNFNCPPGAAASCDINGKPLPYSPDWKAALRMKYSQPFAARLSVDYGVDVTWQSKMNFDLQQQPDSVQEAYSILNASVALLSTDGWRLALVGKNLANKSYSTVLQNIPTPTITRYVPRDDKRYFGVNFRYDF